MRDYAVHWKSQPTIKKGKNPLRYVILVVIIVGVFWLGKNILAAAGNPAKKISVIMQPKNKETLTEEIKEIIENGGGSYSILAYRYKDGRSIEINESMQVTAASVNKIPILATLYAMASNGEIDIDRQVKLQEDDVQDYGTGSIRYDPIGTLYSLKTLARLMMEKSDNTAAHILGKIIVTEDKIQEYVDNWGMTQTNMKDNKTSATDMKILLSKIYDGEIANPALSSEMLDFLHGSDFEDRIPQDLPTGTKVYHKTGDETGKIHDVGIVDITDNTYYIGILTIDMKDEKKTKKNIAKISQLIYDYMKD